MSNSTKQRRGRRRNTKVGMLSLAAFGVFSAATMTSNPAPIAAATPPSSEGVVCAEKAGSAPGTANYVLTATTGVINTPDGNSLLMWGYANALGGFQYPGPILCANEGDQVTVTLRNELPVNTSIDFVGIDTVKVNGRSAQAQFDGATLRSLTDDVAPNGSLTYTFTAEDPGTYLYQSGNDQALQIEMGLVGAVIVYPALAPTSTVESARLAYDDQSTVFSSEHEYMVLLTELDPDVHYAVESGLVTQSDDYTADWKPRYFMINGRSFPDDIAPNGAAWLPTQPYGALAHVEPLSPANPLPALIRYLAVGGEPYPFHPHSNHEKVLAKDGRLLKDGAADISLEKFSIVVDPGSTIDATFTWENIEDYNTVGNPRYGNLPVPQPNGPNLTEGEFWSGSALLGSAGVLNPEVQGKNVCGEYYHVAHNHNLTEATNYGAAFGGQLTLIRVDPSNSANCGNA